MSDEKFTPRKRITGVSKKTPVKEPKIELWYDKEIDTNNKNNFDKCFKKETLKNRYNCCICGKAVSIDGSYSNNGNKLICIDCANNNFSVNGKLSIKKLYDWLDK